MQNLFSRLAAIATLLAAASFAPQALAQNATYQEVNPPQPADEPGKIEVLEFFAYSCTHCNAIEPMVQEWSRKLPEDVVLRKVPVAFNAGMKPLQQLYYTLESMGRLDLHPKVFAAIHQERQRLFSKSQILDWAGAQGLDKAKFEGVYDSFGVASKAQRADQLVQAYRVQGTPSVAVGGRYLTSPAQAGGYRETLTVADELLARVHAAK
ncbi:thiol:disulfide interchange protein DsbA/DsbL [Orrella sp. JC864]